MPSKNTAVSLSLGLLFISLVAIYLVTSQSLLVTGISVLLLAICLFVTDEGDWPEIRGVTTIAAVVSIIAAGLVGQARFGTTGGIILAIVWLVVVWGLFNWFQRSALFVSNDSAVLISRYPSSSASSIYPATPPFARPLMPLFERRVAEIPLYELDEAVRVPKVNTPSGKNIDAITVQVRFQVKDREHSTLVLKGVPNRTQALRDIAKSVGKDPDAAATDLIFWEKLLTHQISQDIDDVVRKVVYTYPYQEIDKEGKARTKERGNVVDAYLARQALTREVERRLCDEVQKWGVNIIRIEMEHFEVDGSAFRPSTADADREANRIKQIRNAEGDAEANRVSKLLGVLKDANVAITPELLESIVLNAGESSNEWGTDVDYNSLLPVAASSGSAADKKPTR